MKDDFRKYATKHLGMSSMVLDDVINSQASYLNPYILEERQLNVTQLDVFSRLMMDRIIFLGTPIDDYTANTLQAQLLYLDSVDSGKDISIYINLYRNGGFDGGRTAGSRKRRKTFCIDPLTGDDSPADGRRTGTGIGY